MANFIQDGSMALLLTLSLWLADDGNAHAHTHDEGKAHAPSEIEPQANSGDDAHEDAEDRLWIDTVQFAVTSTVDAAARWVDRFFGDPRWFDDQPADDPMLATSVGRLSVGPTWDQADGWGVISNLRARFFLPYLENRFSAVVGRLGFDEFMTGDDSARPGLLREPGADNEWLLGLGYDPVIQERRRLSFGAGFRGGLSFDPYLRVRYLMQSELSDRSQLRWQSVVFWRNSDGFGLSQRLDYEISFSERWLGRWSGRGIFAQQTDGFRWRTSGSLFYLYSNDQAYAGEIWARGETAQAVPTEDYGVRAIYRQRYLREWFFVEPWVGMHWPREELDQHRKASWIVGLRLEIIFGQSIMQREP